MDRVFFAEGNLATFTASINNWCFSEQKNAPHIVLYSDSIVVMAIFTMPSPLCLESFS